MIEQNPKAAATSVAAALCLSMGFVLLAGGQAPAAAEWNFYMH
jgi:hypothetical protein